MAARACLGATRALEMAAQTCFTAVKALGMAALALLGAGRVTEEVRRKPLEALTFFLHDPSRLVRRGRLYII